MTIWNGVRPLRIEIHGQPERQRYWAEVELVTQHSGARRVMLESPASEGLHGILDKVTNQFASWDPQVEAEPVHEDSKAAPTVGDPCVNDDGVEGTWQSTPDGFVCVVDANGEHGDEEHDDETDEPEGEASPDQPSRRRRGRPPKVRVQE